MNDAHAEDAIVALLYRQGQAPRHEILSLPGMSADLYEPIRKELIQAGMALEGPYGGLTYVGPVDFADAVAAISRARTRAMVETAWREFSERGAASLSADARQNLPLYLIEEQRWDDLETLLTDLAYLECRSPCGEIRELATDFDLSIGALPADRPNRELLKLLHHALRADLPFLCRHAGDYPQGLFQSLWNRCWWHDSPAAVERAEAATGPQLDGPAPWTHPGPHVYKLMERWEAERKIRRPAELWLRSLRPPVTILGNPFVIDPRASDQQSYGLTYSPDGSRIASVCADHSVRIYDGRTGKELSVLTGHERWVYGVSFSRDSGRIVTGSSDRTVRMWDVETGIELSVMRGHWSYVTSVSFSPDERQIMSCANDRTTRIWDTQTGQIILHLHAHEGLVNAAAWAPDGRRLATASADKTLRVWDAERGVELAVLLGHGNSVESVDFSPDGERIVTGSSDNTVRIWDARTYECIEVVPDSSDVTQLAAGLSVLPYRARECDIETVIEEIATNRPVAWFVFPLHPLAMAPSGRAWAGFFANRLHLLTLEGSCAR